MSAHVKSYAKLNLTLSVLGKSGGYHLLDSLVCNVDLYDYISLKRRNDGQFTVQMHGLGSEAIPYENNNAVKAANAYNKMFPCGGADITIHKNIPLGGGLGGSSADTAGVLLGLARLYGVGGESHLKELADSLGSDSGYMLTGGFARLSGRGEVIQPLHHKKKLHFLLLCPESGVSAAECYSRYDLSPVVTGSSKEAIAALEADDLHALGKCLSNSLYNAAKSLNPEVEEAYESLMEFSPLGVSMSGSGSAVFALFETAELCAWAKSRYRGRFQCIQVKSV